MSIDRIQLLPDHLEDGSVAQSDNAQDHTGHAHFARGPFSRRHFMGAAAGAAGLALGSGLWTPARGQEDEEEDDLATVPPKPIPGGIFFAPAKVFIHHFPPGTANEPSEITDLNGLVADTRILGTGTGTDTTTGTTETLLYQADMGIMKGLYIGEDGRRHRGTFAFI